MGTALSIFNSLPGLYLLLKPDAPKYTIVDFSEAYATSVMVDRSIVGQGLFEAITDDPANPHATGVANLGRSLALVLESGQADIMPVQRYDVFNPARKTFEERYWAAENIPVKGESGTIEYIIHSVVDVTEHQLILRSNRRLNEISKLNESLLRSSEEKYRRLFDHSPATVILWTLDDLRVQEVNQTAIDLYGYSREEFLSMSILDIRPAEEHSRFVETVLTMRDKLEKKSGVWLHKNRAGKKMYMNVSMHRIMYNERPAVLSLGLDITEKVMLEKKLEKERKARQHEITAAVLDAQENERSELARELHDNINQVLITSRLYIEHALHNKDKQEEVLKKNFEHLSAVIKELRRLSRTLMPPSLGEASLRQALQELLADMQHLSHIAIEFTFRGDQDGHLPEQLKLAVFRIVQEQLNNIIRHANASKITLNLHQTQKQLKVEVADDGVGFKEDSVPRGLGLKNMISRANLFDGRIDILSQPGSGTIVRTTFPLGTRG